MRHIAKQQLSLKLHNLQAITELWLTEIERVKNYITNTDSSIGRLIDQVLFDEEKARHRLFLIMTVIPIIFFI